MAGARVGMPEANTDANPAIMSKRWGMPYASLRLRKTGTTVTKPAEGPGPTRYRTTPSFAAMRSRTERFKAGARTFGHEALGGISIRAGSCV